MVNYDALELEAIASAVACPQCPAPAGQRCVNVFTGQPLPAPHWQRLRDARTAPADPAGGAGDA